MKFNSLFPGNHIMVDLETLGTTHNSVILTLGAVRFNPWENPTDDLEKLVAMDCFYRRIDTASFDSLNSTIDEHTLKWWGEQAPEVRAESFAEDDRHPIADVLGDFRRWAGEPDCAWANGICFDVTIIDYFSRETKQAEPWRWQIIRDARTVYALCPEIKRVKYQDAHNALVDCFAQVTQLQRCFKRLGVEYLEGWR